MTASGIQIEIKWLLLPLFLASKRSHLALKIGSDGESNGSLSIITNDKAEQGTYYSYFNGEVNEYYFEK